ncbi:MAG: TonB-dependent receptor plug domain-containing protein [Thermoanaerobaculia bacterium]
MKIVISILAVLTAVSPLFASDVQLDPATVLRGELIVTASATAETLSSTPASASVITAEAIEDKALRDVADALREVPGLTVIRSGSPGKIVSLFTRGGSSKDTLVLWNGIELNNPFFSGFDWGRFSTAGVERIEVVRGPFSAIYGSDAVSGVVNIITDAHRPFVTADFQAGEQGLLNGRVSGAWLREGWKLHGSVEHRADDGFEVNDDMTQSTALVDAQRVIGRASVGARVRWNRYDVGTPWSVNGEGTAFELHPERRESGDELELAIPVAGFFGGAEYEAVISRNERTDEFDDPDDPFGRLWASTDVEIDRASARARYRIGDHAVAAGGEWERSSVDDVSSYGSSLDGRRRESVGAFIEDRYTRRIGPGTLEMSFGARFDDFDSFGSQISPRAAVAWIRGANKIRGGWGEAFRAPSVGELFFPFFGNPDLEAESSTSWELGYERLLSRGRATATLFATDFDELIVYDNLSNRFENAGAGTSRGIELGWQQPLSSRVGLSASYTWLDTEDRDTGERFLRRPEHSGSLAATWTGTEWAASAVALHTGERPDITDLFPWGRVVSEAHTTLDLLVERAFGSLKPYLKIENATDEEYEEIYGYPSAGRRAIVGVRYSAR